MLFLDMLFRFLTGVLGLNLILAEYFGCYAVDLLKQLVEIGYGAEAHIVADRRDRVVGILQLEGCLLQTDLVQVFRHGIAGVLPELSAQVGFAEMKRCQDLVKAGFEIFIHMKASQQLTEPDRIIGVVVADLLLNKKV